MSVNTSTAPLAHLFTGLLNPLPFILGVCWGRNVMNIVISVHWNYVLCVHSETAAWGHGLLNKSVTATETNHTNNIQTIIITFIHK